MGFLEQEKERYAGAKATCSWVSDAARASGNYRGHEYGFCIPEALADENLFAGTRARVLKHFSDGGVKWHGATEAGPSNHLCSSMVCGVNFLSVMMSDAALATLFLQGIFGAEVEAAVPVALDPFVEFEWVGDPDIDYLHEGLARTRGANATSADAAMAYRRPDRGKTLVLIEWKYTESYSPEFKGGGTKGETRRSRYEDLVNDPAGPIDAVRVGYEELLYEPFYQFMRQQLLAWQMEVKGREYGADRVRVLHLSPRANTGFERVTSPPLAARYPGVKATALWQSLLRDPSLFTPVAVEDAFRPLLAATEDAAPASWRAYILERYPWVSEPE